jgi:predicted transcriptional regulator
MRKAKKFKVFSTGYRIVKPRILQVLDSITIGDMTYSGEIMERFGWNKRRSLEYLDKLEKLGHLSSEKGILIQSPKTGAVVPARVFKREK